MNHKTPLLVSNDTTVNIKLTLQTDSELPANAAQLPAGVSSDKLPENIVKM